MELFLDASVVVKAPLDDFSFGVTGKSIEFIVSIGWGGGGGVNHAFIFPHCLRLEVAGPQCVNLLATVILTDILLTGLKWVR